MKAVIFEEYGPPEVLQMAEIEKPLPKDKEVLVEIHATTITAEDPKMRGFNHPTLLKFPVGLMFGFKKPKQPILGIEFSGVVEKVGAKVTKYKLGDQVFGYTGLTFGAYAEYKCIPENGLMSLKPKNLSFVESASLINGPLSAYTYLKKKGKIKNGDEILIYGASGSIGTAAVQLAKYFGATVTGVCSAKNLELVKSIGADFVIDYTKEDFTESSKNYDIIFDCVGKTSMQKCMIRLKPKGKYLLTEFGFSHILGALYTAFFKSKKIIVASSNFYWEEDDLILFKQLAEKRVLKPVIDRIYSLEEIVKAHNYVELGHKVGNVAILVKKE